MRRMMFTKIINNCILSQSSSGYPAGEFDYPIASDIVISYISNKTATTTVYKGDTSVALRNVNNYKKFSLTGYTPQHDNVFIYKITAT